MERTGRRHAEQRRARVPRAVGAPAVAGSDRIRAPHRHGAVCHPICLAESSDRHLPYRDVERSAIL